MSIPVKTVRKGAQYLREFMRANTGDWAELMRESNPSQGWGSGQDAADAYDAAMFLHIETDRNFLDFTVPGDFPSGEHLLSALEAFKGGLTHHSDLLELRSHEAAASDRTSPSTVGLVQAELAKCMSAVDQAVGMLVRKPKVAETEDAFDVLKRIATRFPAVVAQLSRRRADKRNPERVPLTMEDEYDVQYLFQSLLRLEFADIRPEEAMPSTAGGSARADTLLKTVKTIVEFKMTRAGYNAVTLRKELADDFVLYGAHPDCERLFAFVYDPQQHIENPEGVAADLSTPRPPIGQVFTFIQQA